MGANFFFLFCWQEKLTMHWRKIYPLCSKKPNFNSLHTSYTYIEHALSFLFLVITNNNNNNHRLIKHYLILSNTFRFLCSKKKIPKHQHHRHTTTTTALLTLLPLFWHCFTLQTDPLEYCAAAGNVRGQIHRLSGHGIVS